MIKFKKKKNNFTYYALGVQDSQGVPDCVDVVLEGKVLLNVPHGTSVLVVSKPLNLNSVQLYLRLVWPMCSETGLEL